MRLPTLGRLGTTWKAMNKRAYATGETTLSAAQSV